MKKFLLTLILCLTSILSFATGGDKVIDFWVDTETGKLMSNEHGIDVEQIDGSVANYTITVEKLEFSTTHCQCMIRIDANGNHPWDELIIHRMKSRYSDEHVDVEEHAKEDPEWNAYEFSTTHVWFKDTFPKSWIDGYELCYMVHDVTNNHYLYIVIHDAFGHSIVTSIRKVTVNSQSIYYDLQGHGSNKPFKGINIVKTGDDVKKVIY